MGVVKTFLLPSYGFSFGYKRKAVSFAEVTEARRKNLCTEREPQLSPPKAGCPHPSRYGAKAQHRATFPKGKAKAAPPQGTENPLVMKFLNLNLYEKPAPCAGSRLPEAAIISFCGSMICAHRKEGRCGGFCTPRASPQCRRSASAPTWSASDR